MECMEQCNTEEFRMLCLTIEDTTSGICLFQSDNPKSQLEIAECMQKSVQKKCCILDMAQVDKDNLPDEIGKLQKLLTGHKEDEVVVLCNLQICGAMLGDETYIQRLNYMRDQMLVRKKMWVLGMSPYFAVLLGRNARDLYSCIMNHFSFMEEETEHAFLMDEEADYTGDIKLELRRFRELKTRMAGKKVSEADENILLQIVESWNKAHGNYNYGRKTMTWMIEILVQLERFMRTHTLKPQDYAKYQAIVEAWYSMKNYKRALDAGCFIYAQAEENLPKPGIEWAKMDQRLGLIYRMLGQYERAQLHVKRALQYYSEHGRELSPGEIGVRDLQASVELCQGNGERALEIYRELVDDIRANKGEDYYGLAIVWNNMGVTYFAQGCYSQALDCYLRAIDDKYFLRWNYRRQGEIKAIINAGRTYAKIGENDEALAFLHHAEELLTKRGRSAQGDEELRRVYRWIFQLYDDMGRQEQATQYLKLAEDMRENEKRIDSRCQ